MDHAQNLRDHRERWNSAQDDPETTWTLVQFTFNEHDVLRRRRTAFRGAPIPDVFEYAFYFLSLIHI
eukprot:9767834-Alexandrium_andersonii.AAC.1